MKKVLIFDLWGDYGHFRVPYTTTSPLTLPFPPKTALYGIIAAILGYDRDDYLEHFRKNPRSFALQLLKPLQKVRIPENFINTKVAKHFARIDMAKSGRTQIRIEFLKEPAYRIYTFGDTDEDCRLEEMLRNHESTYTLSLGLSECLANYKFVAGSEILSREKGADMIEIDSVLPMGEIASSEDMNFMIPGRKYLKTHIPLEMNTRRELTASGDFILESDGKTVHAKPCRYSEIKDNGNNVIFF